MTFWRSKDCTLGTTSARSDNSGKNKRGDIYKYYPTCPISFNAKSINRCQQIKTSFEGVTKENIMTLAIHKF